MTKEEKNEKKVSWTDALITSSILMIAACTAIVCGYALITWTFIDPIKLMEMLSEEGMLMAIRALILLMLIVTLILKFGDD